MKLKPEVHDDGVCREIWFALGVAEGIHTALFGAELIVTSLRDGTHNHGSLHPGGRAADVRTSDLNDEQVRDFIAHLKNALARDGFDVLREVLGSTPATTAAHIHIGYAPKAGESFPARLAAAQRA